MNSKQILFALAISFSLTTATEAQSMWNRAKHHQVFLFRDTAARQVGDLLTIIVRENTDVGNKDERALEKSTDIGFNFNSSASGDDGSSAGSLSIASDSTRNFDGTSEYKVAQEFEDKITVEVIKVLPNGNMVVSGKRRRQVSGEIRMLMVSGIVRPLDVTASNTVLSRNVANFSICYDGDGPESSFSNQGWAGRVMNKIWPF